MDTPSPRRECLRNCRPVAPTVDASRSAKSPLPDPRFWLAKSLRQSQGDGECDAHDREAEDDSRQPRDFTQLFLYGDPHLLTSMNKVPHRASQRTFYLALCAGSLMQINRQNVPVEPATSLDS